MDSEIMQEVKTRHLDRVEDQNGSLQCQLCVLAEGRGSAQTTDDRAREVTKAGFHGSAMEKKKKIKKIENK